MTVRLRLGTRGSRLARWQAEWVAARLRELPDVEVELVEIATRGDRDQSDPIGGLDAQGVFTKEIQRALIQGQVDLAVHSLKDLPTEPTPELALAAVPPREAAGDALLSRGGERFSQLPSGAVVGTGSVRRRAQLLHARDDLRMADIRGNVDTRLRKLGEGAYDAIILAEAGLSRLGLADQITERLPTSLMLPAVGQGALGIECRADDSATAAIVANLDHLPTHQAVTAERSLLAALRGGCLAPVGALGTFEADGRLRLSAVVLSPDGKARLEATAAREPAAAAQLGIDVAEALLSQGAGGLIKSARA